jgi:hypothetical protein
MQRGTAMLEAGALAYRRLENGDCETASNRDPLPKQDNALITDAKFD